MSADRRSYDPFAPHASASGAEVLGSEPEREERELFSDDPHDLPGGTTVDDELDGMRRVELLELAEREGVAAYGNREALIARIRKHRQG